MTTDYIQANTDGRLHSASEPSISPLNRGFLYGDAIYEVWRTYGGALFAFDEHWNRLEQSARALHLNLPLDRARLLEEIRRTARAFFQEIRERPPLYIRLQVTRGAGPIGLDIALADRSTFVILIQVCQPVPPQKMLNGLRLGLARNLHRNHPLTLNPAWKTGNYLNNILCLREATARGADEVVMTNLQDEITESAVSNIFFIRAGTLVTPPLAAGMLAGITRRFMLDDVAARAGVPVAEEVIPATELGKFQECFITSTTKEITPVSAIDDCAYAVGEASVTRRLMAAFGEHVQDYLAAHPELKITG